MDESPATVLFDSEQETIRQRCQFRMAEMEFLIDFSSCVFLARLES